jgi:signal transduction histidine kinase
MAENNLTQYDAISLLYVEDEAATREQVSRVLAARGYSLTIAENGEQGLELFCSKRPDIVLTDIMMPRLNGLEMARAIRAMAPQIQIACMTAFSDTNYLIDAIDIGVNQFILKPVEFERLFNALDRCQEMVRLRKGQLILEAAITQAKKNEAIGILAGGMAHDFNNLLQVILGYVSLAKMNAEPGSKTESLLAIVEQSSDSARELSSRLLTFAKGGDAYMKPAHLEQIIKDGVEQELPAASPITPIFDFPDNLPLVKLDTGQIQQVAVNLAQNACEAMPQGGSLHISIYAASLAANNDFALPPGDYLHLLFEDSGVGIPHENLPKIFDPYFSTKEIGCQKGMGLGLALCQSIIKHHKGHINAESIKGGGTRIHIYLPAYKQPE